METKKVFVLEWNPAFSSYTEAQFAEEYESFDYAVFNWSIWDWEKAHEGDVFFLIKCGKDGKTGIVQQGVFSSEPWAGEDWSGKGRPTKYIDMDVQYMIDYKKAPILTTQELEAAMPEFQWNGGHSGREVPFEYACKLEEMWTEYLEKNLNIFDGEKAKSQKYKPE